jgi:hypothetical protein
MVRNICFSKHLCRNWEWSEEDRGTTSQNIGPSSRYPHLTFQHRDKWYAWSASPNERVLKLPWVVRPLGHLPRRQATNPPTINRPRDRQLSHVTIVIYQTSRILAIKTLESYFSWRCTLLRISSVLSFRKNHFQTVRLLSVGMKSVRDFHWQV